MKKRIAQADPPKEASMFERMNDRLKLLSSNKMTKYFKEWTIPSSVLKKIYYPYKHLTASDFCALKTVHFEQKLLHLVLWNE